MSLDNIDPVIIKVKVLEKEYETELNKYREALNNYINALKIQKNVELQGRTWWGSSSLKEGEASTISECQTMCSLDNKCSGATFNSVKKYCWTRSGDGDISVGDESDYAIIPNHISSLKVLQTINNNLLELNEKILNEFKNIQPEVLKQNTQMSDQELLLSDYYKKLLEEKDELNKQLNEYYSVEQNNEHKTLFVEQQNARYNIWAVIAMILILIAIAYITHTSSGLIISIFMFLVFLIILSYTLKTPSGFMISFIAVLGIILWNNRSQ